MPRHTLDLSFGSFDHKRAVLRSSAPLVGKQLAYGLVYGVTDEKSYIENMFTRDQYYSGALLWRPLPELTLSGRFGSLDREAGRRPHTVVSHPLFQQRDREAIEQFDRLGLPRPAAYPQLENGAVRTPAGVPITTGRATPETVDSFIARTLGANVAPYPGVFSRDFFPNDSFNYNGDDGRDSYQNKTSSLEAEWIPSREFAVHGLFQQVDSNRMRREFNGLRPVAGQRLRSTISDYKPGGVNFSAKLEGVYKLDLQEAGKHDFLGGFQHDGGKDVISPITVATSRVITYNPKTDPKPRLLQLLRDQYGADYNEPGVVRKGAGHSNAWYGILQSSFLNDRIRTLAGGRRITNHRPVDDNRDGRDEDFKISKALPHFAALVRLTPQLSIYGSVSRSFQPQRQQTADLEAKYQAAAAAIVQRRDGGKDAADKKYPPRIAALSTSLKEDLDKIVQRRDARLAAADARRDDRWTNMTDHWRQVRTATAAAYDEANRIDAEAFRSWDDLARDDVALPAVPPPGLRFGTQALSLAKLPGGVSSHPELNAFGPTDWTQPAIVPFPNHASLLIKTTADQKEIASEMMQALTLRIATGIPAGQSRFTIIDPLGLGKQFAGFMHLADHDELLVTSRIWTEPQQIEQRLADITEQMEVVIQKYLRNEYESIGGYNADAEVPEPYRFVVVANFPANFTETSARRLASIAASGARCGVYVILSIDTKAQMPANFSIAEIEKHATTLVLKDGTFTWSDPEFSKWPLTVEQAPSDEVFTQIIQRVGKIGRAHV